MKLPVSICRWMFIATSSFLFSTSISVKADPLDQWTRIHPFPNWAGGAFGANRFVVVGESGLIQSSDDGTNWVKRVSGTTNSLTDVVFANGKFVAVGGQGVIRLSSNGNDWSAASSGAAVNLTGVTYGNGLFVATGASGTVLTSADGASWGVQSGVSASLALQSVTFGNNLFMAVTGSGEIIQSFDGTNWFSQPSQGGAPSKVAWVNNQFVIVDYGMKISSDGTNWSAANYVYPVLANIIYTGGYYVGVGNAVGSGNGGSILYSQDLTNWTTAVNDPTAYAFSTITCGNGMIVAGGMHGQIRTSTDHVNWTIRAKSLTYLADLYAIKYINGQFVAAGNSGVSPGGVGEDSPLLFSAPTGDDWSRRPSGVFSTIWDLAYGKGLYVVANSFGVTTSTNGINWTSVGTGLSSQLAGLTFASNLFVLTSWSGGISTSEDGVTWTPRASGSTRNLWGTAFGNGIWVSVGQSSSTGGYITSTDGTNWTSHSITANLRNVAFGNGTFVIVGNSGYIGSSTTGLSWTARTSGTAGTIYGVCFGDGYFVAVGTSGYMATSPDGVTWTGRTSGTTSTLERVAYGGGSFVATGVGGLLIRSASTIASVSSKTVGGGVRLDLLGGFDRAYGIESSTNLNGADWSRLTTLSSGQRLFVDTDIASSRKFYRLVFP